MKIPSEVAGAESILGKDEAHRYLRVQGSRWRRRKASMLV
jgi:hypothetical protein